MNDKINFIRDKCIAANPAREEQWQTQNGKSSRPARLADVLLAIEDYSRVIEAGTGQFGETTAEGVFVGGMPAWNLRADDLEKQSEECINFLYELLK